MRVLLLLLLGGEGRETRKREEADQLRVAPTTKINGSDSRSQRHVIYPIRTRHVKISFKCKLVLVEISANI